jgi:hypothetical protein
MAKEIDLDERKVFVSDLNDFLDTGRKIGDEVLDELGGYSGLLDLPFDRGDTNRALVAICLKVAKAFEIDRPDLANSLHSEAFRICMNAQELGSARKDLNVGDLLQKLELAWRDLDSSLRVELKEDHSLVGHIAEVIDVIKVLFVYCTPIDQDQDIVIRSAGELKAISESIKSASATTRVLVEALPAATPDDLRRKLLHENFHIVHFSGHSDENNLIFENESGNTIPVPIESIRKLFERRPLTKCVILNSCESVKKLVDPIAQCTIGLDEVVEDAAAIQFSRGFYDAIAMSKSFGDAFEEGKLATALSNHPDELFRILQ